MTLLKTNNHLILDQQSQSESLDSRFNLAKIYALVDKRIEVQSRTMLKQYLAALCKKRCPVFTEQIACYTYFLRVKCRKID